MVFRNRDYASHTSCISEAEKYEGSMYKQTKAKASPQEAWLDNLRAAAEVETDPQVKSKDGVFIYHHGDNHPS